MRSLIALLTVLISVALNAQTTSTKCGAESVTVFPGGTIDLRLIGCGDGFADNLLWHLDRADSKDGTLDAKVTRRATGKGAVVYLVDTGVMASHDEFTRAEGSVVIGAVAANGFASPACPAGRNAALDPCYRSDIELQIFSHGTATASVVNGRNTGVAPDAKVVSVYAFTAGNSVDGWIANFDAVIRHAYDPTTPQFKTGIISMSGVPNRASVNDPRFPAMETKIRQMIAGVDPNGNSDPAGKKFLFVVLAGNHYTDANNQCDANLNSNLFPSILGSSIDGLITVGGIDITNRLWDGSCRGSAVDILAPAANMFVASLSGRDRYRSGQVVSGITQNSGTSFATPYVAGIAATYLEKNSDLTPVELEQMIKVRASHTANADEVTASGRVAVFDLDLPSTGRRPGRR